MNSHINFFHLPVIKNRTVLTDVNKQQDRVGRNPHFIKPVSHCYSYETGTPLWRHSLTVVLNNSLLLELLPKKQQKGKIKLKMYGYKLLYSQLSLRRTPLGPALSVRLREVSVL